MSGIPLSKRSDLIGSASLLREGRSVAARAGLPIATAVAVAAPAAANGAYFPTAWGWTAFAFGWAALLTVVLDGVGRLGRFEWTMLGALTLLTTWTTISALWSRDVSQTALEFQRALVYVTAALAAMLVVRRATVSHYLAGIVAAIAGVCAYSLATRLFPERLAEFDEFAVNRLQQPLGYWNSLGTFAAMGVLLSLGFVARARALWGRALAGAALPIVSTTLYFTFGRGAWIALAAGLVAALVLDRARLQLLTAIAAVAPFAAAAVWLSSRFEALTSRAPDPAEAAADGRALAPIMAGLVIASGAAAVLFAVVERRVSPRPRVRFAYASLLLLGGLAAAAWIFASYGAPWTIADRAYHQFVDAPPAIRPAPGERIDLNRRLFTLSGNGRVQFWSVGWTVAREHPVLGSGAGTYEQHWLRERPFESDARDAHSLYLETLAELGPPGVALLAVALGVPLVAAVRARRRRLGGAVTGAYVVYVVHAAADWDWEMVAVTVTAIFCGVGLLVAARADETRRRAPTRARIAVAALALVAVSLSFGGWWSNRAIAESERASAAEEWTRAEREARAAIRWAPWSARGWEALGQAQLLQAELGAARESFRRALEKDPYDWNLWLNLAYSSTGAEQRRAAERALALNPLSSAIARVRPAIGLPPADG